MQKLPAQSKNFEKRKRLALILSIVFDVVGMISYIFPALGESFDFIWAPIAGLANILLFGGWAGILGGVGTFAEELLPFTDFIPSFLIMWFVKFVLLEKRTRQQLDGEAADASETRELAGQNK